MLEHDYWNSRPITGPELLILYSLDKDYWSKTIGTGLNKIHVGQLEHEYRNRSVRSRPIGKKLEAHN